MRSQLQEERLNYASQKKRFYETIKPRQVSQQDQRRMAKCLLVLALKEMVNSLACGKQRNQARFTRASDS